jgi:iron complex outermembrane receptor protein
VISWPPIRLLALGAAIAAGALALADDAPEEETTEPKPEFEERVLVRERPAEDADPAAFRTTITGEELSGRAGDLADVLRRVPGARVRDYGGLGSYATVSVRASTAEQVRVLVDGVPQNRALGGPVDLSSIPATQIDEIHVWRGFSPTGLGPGAVGGVIDVRSKPPGSEPDVAVDLVAGELGTRRASASLALPSGRASGFRADAEGISSDGDFLFLDTGGTPGTTDDDVVRSRTNNDLESLAVQLQQGWNELGRSRLRLSLRLHDRERGVPWVDNLATQTARHEERLADLTASWTRTGGERSPETRVILDGFDQKLRFFDPDGDFGVATDRHTEMSGGGASCVLRHTRGPHRLQLRADARRERVSVRDDRLPQAPERGGSRRTILGLALEDALALGRWVVAPSLRWDRRDDDFVAGSEGTLPAPAADVTEDGWSGKLGVAYSLAGGTTIRGSAGSAFRSPNLLELFGDRGSLRGNPGLRAERSRAVELGVAHRGTGDALAGSVEVVGFARRTDDLIYFRQQSQGVAVATNLLDARVYGIETSAGVSWRTMLHVDLGVTRQRATDCSGGPFDGRPLIYHPEWLGYLGLRWKRNGWHVGWEITYTGENSTDEFDTPELRLPERILHDLVAGRRWPSGLRLSLDVRNVFDRRTVDVARYPLPDRVAFVHVGWHEGGRR